MSDDENMVRRIIQSMEDAWNAGDSHAFAASYAEDAECVNILGEYYKGRRAIETSYRQIFDTIYKDSRQNYTVDTIRFVRPDVAVAIIHAKLLSRVGSAVADADRMTRIEDALSESRTVPMLVLAKNSGKWQIVGCQNTKVAVGG